MAKDDISIGCAGIIQVNSDHDYIPAMKEECKETIKRLLKKFPPPKDSSGYLKIQSNSHDFGIYYDIVAVFDDRDEKAFEWALKLESVDLDELMKGWKPSYCVKCGAKTVDCTCDKVGEFQPYL